MQAAQPRRLAAVSDLFLTLPCCRPSMDAVLELLSLLMPILQQVSRRCACLWPCTVKLGEHEHYSGLAAHHTLSSQP